MKGACKVPDSEREMWSYLCFTCDRWGSWWRRSRRWRGAVWCLMTKQRYLPVRMHQAHHASSPKNWSPLGEFTPALLLLGACVKNHISLCYTCRANHEAVFVPQKNMWTFFPRPCKWEFSKLGSIITSVKHHILVDFLQPWSSLIWELLLLFSAVPCLPRFCFHFEFPKLRLCFKQKKEDEQALKGVCGCGCVHVCVCICVCVCERERESEWAHTVHLIFVLHFACCSAQTSGIFNRNIEELQEKNQQLLEALRDLSKRREEEETQATDARWVLLLEMWGVRENKSWERSALSWFWLPSINKLEEYLMTSCHGVVFDIYRKVWTPKKFHYDNYYLTVCWRSKQKMLFV